MKVLFLIPSAYGLATFTAGFALYQINLIGYVHAASDANLMFAFAIAAFACSLVINTGCFQQLLTAWDRAESDASQRLSKSVAPALVMLHLIGLYGIYRYLLELVAYFGSPVEVLAMLGTTSYKIRQASEDIQDVGTQLSYLGWIAVWTTAYYAGRRSAGSLLWVLMIAQVIANTLYIDRTRPVWILFGGALVFVVARYQNLSSRTLVRWAALSFATLLVIFVSVGAWIGKVSLDTSSADNRSVLPAAIEPVYIYATSGFAYFDQIVAAEAPGHGLPERLLYPAITVANKLGLSDRPPPQINDFKNVPVPTNVGTFLEPMYRDAGAVGVITVTLIIVFGGDRLALFFLRRRCAGTLVAWSTLCFIDFIAFFTPKVSSTPTWLFISFGVLTAIMLPSSRIGEHESVPTVEAPSRD